jgi:hypothetical protein
MPLRIIVLGIWSTMDTGQGRAVAMISAACRDVVPAR